MKTVIRMIRVPEIVTPGVVSLTHVLRYTILEPGDEGYDADAKDFSWTTEILTDRGDWHVVEPYESWVALPVGAKVQPARFAPIQGRDNAWATSEVSSG